MIKIPQNFDGAKFAAKYSLDPFKDFYVNRGDLICLSLPNLTEEDLLDCLVDPPSPFIEFEKPISAPDFIVSTPEIKNDPFEALQEAVAEMEKGKGNKKSIALITLSQAKYLKHLERQVDKLEKKLEKMDAEIEKLKKKA